MAISVPLDRNADSPPTSLRGMELAISSFRSVSATTALVEGEKPLPPLPLRTRKPSRYSPSDSAIMCSSRRKNSYIYGHSNLSGHFSDSGHSSRVDSRQVRGESLGRKSSRRFGRMDLTGPPSVLTTAARDGDSIALEEIPFYLEWRNELRKSLSSDSSMGSLTSYLTESVSELEANITGLPSTKCSEPCRSYAVPMALEKPSHEHLILQKRVYTSPRVDGPATETNAGSAQDCALDYQRSLEDHTRHNSSPLVPPQKTQEERYSPFLCNERHQSSGCCYGCVNESLLHDSKPSPARGTPNSLSDYRACPTRLSQADPAAVLYKILLSDGFPASPIATQINTPRKSFESASADISWQEYNTDPNNHALYLQYILHESVALIGDGDIPQLPAGLQHNIRRIKSRHLTGEDLLKRKTIREWPKVCNDVVALDFSPVPRSIDASRTSARSSAAISSITADSLGGTSYTGSDGSDTLKQAHAVQLVKGAVERVVGTTRPRDTEPLLPYIANNTVGSSTTSRYSPGVLRSPARNNSTASTSTSAADAWSNFVNSAIPGRRFSDRCLQTSKAVPPALRAPPSNQELDKSMESGVVSKTKLSDVVLRRLRANKVDHKAEKRREGLLKSIRVVPREEAGPSRK